VRVLETVRVAAYDRDISFEEFNAIEITNAAPAYAEAIKYEIENRGGKASIVSKPQSARTCLFTEGLTEERPAKRHHDVLMAMLSAHEGVHVVALDRTSAGSLSVIGGVSGLCRSLRIERPEIRASTSSLRTSGDIQNEAFRVAMSLILSEGDYTLSNDGIYQDVPGEVVLPPSAASVITGSPVWLITGGGRGVTADCAIELAKRTGGSFILLGRSDLVAWPTWLERETDLKALRGALARNSGRADAPKKPVEIDRFARKLLAGAEIVSTLKAIESNGAKARYVQADIGDQASLRTTLSRLVNEEGSVTGLVHGAGVLSDGFAEALGLDNFEKVFSPKVTGLETILSCIEPSALRYIGLFSSASAVFGNEGQSNYAAANEWLNNVAVHLAGKMPDTQVKAFCWGPWQGGMVDESLARMFAERGIGLISKQEGARIFADQLLNSSHNQVRFVVGDEWGSA
jgi:NAD(P)-dependent dehydrogenase (short-subunit alcohol dehydrogenase family)